MAKMLKKAEKIDKANLEVVKDMAYNLGITRKDFYLKLWMTSEKEDNDIEQYLLPCLDVPSIKR